MLWLVRRGGKSANAMANQSEESALAANIAAYENMQAQLEEHHMSEWVVFHETNYVDSFDSFDTAAREAVRRFGRGPYLIRQVGGPPRQLPISALERLRSIYA